MTTAEKYIVDTYSGLFDRLKSVSKTNLFKKLSLSVDNKKKRDDEEFFAAFGAFGSEKSPEKIADEIKKSRRFTGEDIKI